MKHSAIFCTIAAVGLGLSSASLAQGNSRRDAPDQFQQHRSYNPRHVPPYQPQERYHPSPYPRQQEYYRDGRHNDRRDSYNARGPEFHHGGYMPREYRHRQYVVKDYRMHRLAPPPRGHEWVQVGTDYVLIAIATGLIAQIILGY